VALGVALAPGASPGFVPDVADPADVLGFGLVDAEGCAAAHPASSVTDATIPRRASAVRRGRATMDLFLTSTGLARADRRM